VTEADLGDFFESDTLPIDESLRDAIFALLAREVLVQGIMTDFGYELDESEVDIVYDDLVAQMEAAGLTPGDFLGVPDASLGMVRFNAEIGVLRDQAVRGLIAQPETLDVFFSDPAAYTSVCVRHLLVETNDEALDAIDRLEAGELFPDIATELSLDTGTPNGDLGCAVASRYVPEFAEAALTGELGTLVGPVETTFGFHVLVVDERTAPTEEQLKADPETYMTDQDMSTLWGDWFNATLGAAEVDVDPKYGTWSAVGIVPPDDTAGE
jgi:parvulin-like peptidyl-prolyl isomerase